MDSTFHLELSWEELQWLAHTFNVISLPIPDAWRRRSAPVAHADLQKGLISLQTRGLIRRSPEAGWQIDKLLLMLISWLGTAQSFLRVEIFRNTGVSKYFHIFPTDEQGMSLHILNERACLTIYEDHEMMHNEILDMIGSPTSTGDIGETYKLSDPISLLPAAWRTPHLLESMLRVTDTQVEVFELTRLWITMLRWCARLDLVSLEIPEGITIRRYVICGNEEITWGGVQGEDSKVSFSPLQSQEIDSVLR